MIEPLRRNHHTVPKFYLERFAIEGEIGVLDLTTNKIWTSGAKATAVIKDFYMVYDDSGDPLDLFEVEFLDRQVEAPAAPVLRKAAAGEELTEKEREVLAVFIGVQSVRGQAFPKPVENALIQLGRLQFKTAAELVARGYDVPEVTEALKEINGREPTEEDYKEFVETATATDEYEYKINRAALVPMYMELGVRTAQLLLPRLWQVIHLDDPALITGDEPVWLETEDEAGPYGEGLGTAPGVWLALDPLTALRMGHPDVGEIDPGDVDAHRLNKAVVAQSQRFVYGDPAVIEAFRR